MALSKTKKILIGVASGIVATCGILITIGALLQSKSSDEEVRQTGKKLWIGTLSALIALTGLACCCAIDCDGAGKTIRDTEAPRGTNFNYRGEQVGLDHATVQQNQRY